MTHPFPVWSAPLLCAALALGSPALGAGAPAPDGNPCAAMMARWQGAEAEYSALKPPDLNGYNTAQNLIDRAAHHCQAGHDAEAARIMADSRKPPPDLQDFSAKASP